MTFFVFFFTLLKRRTIIKLSTQLSPDTTTKKKKNPHPSENKTRNGDRMGTVPEKFCFYGPVGGVVDGWSYGYR